MNRRSDPSSLVLEGLLALGKDQRYHRQTQQLVRDVISDSTAVEGSYADEEGSSRSDLTSSSSSESSVASLVASLWMAAVVWRRGKGTRTPGMEACGLEFAHNNKNQWRATISLVASALSQWYLLQRHKPSDMDRGSSSSRSSHSTRRRSRRNESLRGAERRQVFEQQRQAMLERSSSSSSSSRHLRGSSPVCRRAGDAKPLSPHSSQLSRSNLWSVVLGMVRQVVALAAEGAVEWGPHSSSTAAQTQAQHQRLDALTVGSWIARLHLAFYCLGGRYASCFHRLFRLAFARGRGGSDRLVHRPTNSASAAGLLIVAQALGASVPVVARSAFRYLDSKGYLTLAGRSHLPYSTSSSCIEFVAKSSPAYPSSSTAAASSSSSSSRICMICRQPRKHPGCPPCGHVFCWPCLQRWLVYQSETGKGQSCPYCRTPCRPQDVVALHRY
jgi:hypothetical protein